MASESVHRHLLKHVIEVEENYPLQSFNPLQAGGVADYFTKARSTVELASAVKAAIDLNLPYLVVGEGEGILFSEGGFPGLVIHNQTSSFGVAKDKSQMVVDSGLSLSRFVTLAASHGLGGLTYLYGEKGTVGGALYSNACQGTTSILSSVRYATLIMPPARLDKEATIVRYRSDWLGKSSEQTKLQYLRSIHGFEVPEPVILTILFQLTSVRSDELRLRMQQQLQHSDHQVPKQAAMGPIFSADPQVPVNELLIGAGVAKLRVGSVYPDRYHPNFLCSREKNTRSVDIRELIEEMQERVRSVYQVDLHCRYEYLGVW